MPTVSVSTQRSAGWRKSLPSLISVYVWCGVLSLGPWGNKFQGRTLETGTVTSHNIAWSQDGGISRRRKQVE